MKLLVIPNDPYKNYIQKGEVKKKYFNPNLFFDKVFILNYDINEFNIFNEVYIGDKTYLLNFKKLYPIYRPFLFIKNIIKLKNFIKDNEIQILRSYNSNLQGFYCFILSRMTRIPYVISNHIDNDDFRKIFSKNWKYKLYNFISKYFYEKISLKNANKIINVTNYLNAYSMKYTGNLLKTEVIYNKVYADQFFIRRNGITNNHIRCIFVGKINDQKDPFLLVDIVKIFKNLSLTIIGDGNRSNELKDKIFLNSLGNRIKMIKSVPNKDINNFYKNSDVLLMCTNTEGFCIPILEAMAAGLIVISNNIPPIKEILSDSGILVDKNIRSYALALKKIMIDQSFVKKIQKKAIRRAKHLDGRIFENLEEKLYKDLLNG